MAPVTDSSTGVLDKHNKSGGSSIWTTLLSDTSTNSMNASLLLDKSVVVLGNDLSGKSVLTTKLQGLEKTHRGSALDFQAIEVQDEDVDESGLCRVWILDGHLAHRNLLDFALPKQMVSQSIALIVVDMSQPWNIPESLQKWINVVRDHIGHLGFSATELDAIKQQVETEFRCYTEPSETSTQAKVKSVLDQPTAISGELALSENLAMPLIVVCSKCDCMESLELDFDFKEEHFDFIQCYLRTFCLRYGASLVYTSMKENKNIEVLKKYILHKFYDFSFQNVASVVERDAVFIPSGWDSESKINILKDNLTKVNADDAFDSVIAKPPSTRLYVQEMKEVTADDEQAFLAKAQAALAKASVSSKPLQGSKPSKEERTGINPVGGVGGIAKPIKLDGKPGGASNERMLASFFNSLLNKTPAGGAAPLRTGKTPQKSRTATNKAGDTESNS
uniref:Dynein light intermediate chain n=1 Tax=Phallusia mammillata TaxID=59560 RepID=A0A6F9DAW8_9ASCI|nr:cytoplasmic dynein 1 light intermediate chain 1-like [Phallusia mammillata]